MQQERPTEPSDLQLVEGLRSGDHEAAHELVQRLAQPINRTVFRLTGWHSDTQDIVQDVFLQIQQSAPNYRGDSKIETWAMSIAINCCRKWRRRQASQPSREHYDQSEVIDVNSLNSHVLHEEQEIVRQGLKALNHDDQELIVLRYLEEIELDELTRLFRLKKNTLEVRLVRARKRLAEIIQQLENTNDRNARVQA